MITIDTLLKLIEVRQELIKTAEKFGYYDLRFFRSTDERDVINIIGNYRKGTRDDATAGEDIEKHLVSCCRHPYRFGVKGQWD